MLGASSYQLILCLARSPDGAFVWLSYDLDLDMRLAEETTVLVENYTVRPSAFAFFTFVASFFLQLCPERRS